MTALERLRTAVTAMTDAPWFDRGRLVSRVKDNTGMGATMHANHIANAASSDDSAGIVALRNAVPALLDLAEAVQRWKEAVCEYPYRRGCERGDFCDGEKHFDDCRCEAARQAVIVASRRLEAL